MHRSLIFGFGRAHLEGAGWNQVEGHLVAVPEFLVETRSRRRVLSHHDVDDRRGDAERDRTRANGDWQVPARSLRFRLLRRWRRQTELTVGARFVLVQQR